MALSILLHPPTALWRREALAASRGTFWVRMDGASSLRIYIQRFRAEYNHQRPHEALGQQPPATVWHPSPRPYPRRLAHPEYPGHHLVPLVPNAGTFRFKAQQLFLSQALKQDYIGLEETADGVWSIYFYDVLLGKLHERDFRIYA